MMLERLLLTLETVPLVKIDKLIRAELRCRAAVAIRQEKTRHNRSRTRSETSKNP